MLQKELDGRFQGQYAWTLRLTISRMAIIVLSLAAAAPPPSVPGDDAPELARLGPFAVGVRVLTLTHRDQMDPIASLATGRIVTVDRALKLTIWYPAMSGGTARPYSAELPSEPPRASARFAIPAIAVPGARPLRQSQPVVIVSHGYSNDPVMMSWLTENLASKGYVVVAIGHGDPPITDRTRLAIPLLDRPLDIAFVANAIRKGLLGTLADPARIALVGYSMGGYGVLTAGGARLASSGSAMGIMPPHLLERYEATGSEPRAMDAGPIKAVIALAPAGGAPLSSWGRDGLAGVTAPLLVIAGDADRTVGYAQGPAAIFAGAVHSQREMLVFHGAGHSLGVDPAPPEMRVRLWDMDWFEDPIWRKDRLNAISLHFITAFLDLHLKGDQSRAAYFSVAAPESRDAPWRGPDTPYDAVSGGGPNPAWKGFQKNHQEGLELLHLDPGP